MSELLIEGLDVSYSKVIEIFQINNQIPALVRELILEHQLADIQLEADLEKQLLDEFRDKNNLKSDESFLNYLADKYLNDELLMKIITRPERIVRFREDAESWKQAA